MKTDCKLPVPGGELRARTGSMRRWIGLGGLLITIASPLAARAEPSESPATPVAPTAPAPTPESRLTGDFQFAGGDGERAARTRAIEKSVAEVFFAIRGIARTKLEEKTRIASAVTLRFENGQIRCGIPGAPDAVSPADGRSVDYTVGGETVKLTQRMDGGRLVQTFASADGSRTNIYVPSDDGERYSMQVTVSSPRLPIPVVYSLTYARKH